jgi:hypothetical protein
VGAVIEGKVIPTPDKPNAELVKRTNSLVQMAVAVQVTTPEESVDASAVLQRIAGARRFIEGVYKTAKAPLLEAQRKLIQQEKDLVAPLVNAEELITERVTAFRAEEDRRRRLVLAAQREEAEAKARKEAEERAAKLRAAAAEADTKKAAQALERHAKAIEAAPPVIEAIDAPEEAQTLASGTHDRATYSAVLLSLEPLVLAVAAKIMLQKHGGAGNERVAAYLRSFNPDGHASLDALQANMPELNRLARALKDSLSVPGVEVQKKTKLVSRGSM